MFPIYSDCKLKKIVLGSVNNQSKKPCEQHRDLAETLTMQNARVLFPAVSEDLLTTPIGKRVGVKRGFSNRYYALVFVTGYWDRTLYLSPILIGMAA